MPAFLHAEFWNLANAELWVGIGMAFFLLIAWKAGAFKTAGAALDAKAQKIQIDLDEAARIRDEAKALLADIARQRTEADAQVKAMIEAAQEQAQQMAVDAKTKLAETIKLRTAIAERRIATAEAEAAAQVRDAAIDLASRATEALMVQQLAGAKSDPLVDRGIAQLAAKLQ